MISKFCDIKYHHEATTSYTKLSSIFLDLRRRLENAKGRRLSKEEKRIYLGLAQKFIDNYLVERVTAERSIQEEAERAKKEAAQRTAKFKATKVPTASATSNVPHTSTAGGQGLTKNGAVKLNGILAAEKNISPLRKPSLQNSHIRPVNYSASKPGGSPGNQRVLSTSSGKTGNHSQSCASGGNLGNILVERVMAQRRVQQEAEKAKKEAAQRTTKCEATKVPAGSATSNMSHTSTAGGLRQAKNGAIRVNGAQDTAKNISPLRKPVLDAVKNISPLGKPSLQNSHIPSVDSASKPGVSPGNHRVLSTSSGKKGNHSQSPSSATSQPQRAGKTADVVTVDSGNWRKTASAFVKSKAPIQSTNSTAVFNVTKESINTAKPSSPKRLNPSKLNFASPGRSSSYSQQSKNPLASSEATSYISAVKQAHNLSDHDYFSSLKVEDDLPDVCMTSTPAVEKPTKVTSPSQPFPTLVLDLSEEDMERPPSCYSLPATPGSTQRWGRTVHLGFFSTKNSLKVPLNSLRPSDTYMRQ